MATATILLEGQPIRYVGKTWWMTIVHALKENLPSDITLNIARQAKNNLRVTFENRRSGIKTMIFFGARHAELTHYTTPLPSQTDALIPSMEVSDIVRVDGDEKDRINWLVDYLINETCIKNEYWHSTHVKRIVQSTQTDTGLWGGLITDVEVMPNGMQLILQSGSIVYYHGKKTPVPGVDYVVHDEQGRIDVIQPSTFHKYFAEV